MEVEVDKEPLEGEVLIFTLGGGFLVKGSTHDIAQRLAADDWAHLELAESGDTVIIRSAQVIALRGGTRAQRGAIGFTRRRDAPGRPGQ